jgi:lipid II:glycine glycyltransferase (peptidoglycan interpeptide bridge formation enzyme)
MSMLATVHNLVRHSLVRVERPARRLVAVHDPSLALWHRLVTQHGACALQSAEWGGVKAACGWEATRVAVLEDGLPVAGAQVLFRPTPFGTLAYVPRGPVASFDDGTVADHLMSAITRAARDRNAIAVRIEPNTPGTPGLDAFARRWRLQCAQTVQPRSTVIVELAAGPAAVWDRLSARTRYNVRLAGRRGVQVLDGEESDVPLFHALLTDTARRAGFAVHSLEYFASVWKWFGRQGLARLLFARRDGQVLAGSLDLTCGRMTYHVYAASSDAGREHKPNDLLQWEAIRRAQCEGSSTYDMWGIPDEVGMAWERGWPEPTAGDGGLWGVYAFKRGFGGGIVRYAGAFDLPLSPHRHWLMCHASDRLRWLKTRVNAAGAVRRVRADR